MKKLFLMMMAGALVGCAGHAGTENAAAADTIPIIAADDAADTVDVVAAEEVESAYEQTPEVEAAQGLVNAVTSAVTPAEKAPAARPAGEVIDITMSQYRNLVADYTSAPDKYVGSKPAIVDFWAPWCGPCRALSPILHRVASTTGITVYKVNVDNAAELAEVYGIQAIPTLFFCTPGNTIKRFTGLPEEENIMLLAANMMK